MVSLFVSEDVIVVFSFDVSVDVNVSSDLSIDANVSLDVSVDFNVSLDVSVDVNVSLDVSVDVSMFHLMSQLTSMSQLMSLLIVQRILVRRCHGHSDQGNRCLTGPHPVHSSSCFLHLNSAELRKLNPVSQTERPIPFRPRGPIRP